MLKVKFYFIETILRVNADKQARGWTGVRCLCDVWKAMKILPGGSDEGETGIEQAGREGERIRDDQCEGWFQQRNETVPVEDVRHRLLLEAVTFGSFLWDVESHVDSRYHFVLNESFELYVFTLCVWFFCKYWVSPFYRLLQRRSFGQGKRRVNKRTSLAQKEDVIKRTVYVSDIDQHRAFDEGCRGVIAKTVRFSQSSSQADQIMEERENDRNRSVMV
ncbi:BnaA09g35140D [Brassica napus]|uniref:BnaA09g35140D protein n=3 Tax=Brassica TaxID=3705 RepID=A0A078HQW2_BRANA|nr:BnaA09g35140D [Brassica napus]